MVIVIRILIILQRLVAAFFIFVVYKPLRPLLRWVYYKVVVRLYGRYLAMAKKAGDSKMGNDVYSLLFNQKLVHVLVIFISCTLIFFNLTTKTRADEMAGSNNKSLLTSIVSNEFGDAPADNQYIVESSGGGSTTVSVNQSYLGNSSTIKAQPKVEMNSNSETTQDEESPVLAQGGSAVVMPDIAATNMTKRQRGSTIIYTVKPGDTISTIAGEFEISVNTVLWANNLNSFSIIRPGDKLSILPMNGITHTITKGETLASIAKKYNVEEKVILSANDLASAADIKVGEKLILPGGQQETAPQPQVQPYTGISAIKDIVKAPIAKPVAGNKMHWPTVGGTITQYYSMSHTAVDIANKLGTPIFAADAGKVIFAGWSTGYGNNIVIDHGGGKETRYAHMEKFYVDKGQEVSKGQTIGAMGSTGWSTGPHVHFEVIINGIKYNPLNYISR